MIKAFTDPELFENYGCVLVKNFLDPLTVKTISVYLQNKISRGEWTPRENEKTTKFAFYADPLIETVLIESLQTVESSCGRELDPTYSYTRVYQGGERLEPHVDRPSCEISVTVNIAAKGLPSPIWMHYKDNDPQSYILNCGDAVVYKGCETKHWRNTLGDNQLNVQFMLHYVDKNGPYANLKYDSRPGLGFPSESRRA